MSYKKKKSEEESESIKEIREFQKECHLQEEKSEKGSVEKEMFENREKKRVQMKRVFFSE